MANDLVLTTAGEGPPPAEMWFRYDSDDNQIDLIINRSSILRLDHQQWTCVLGWLEHALDAAGTAETMTNA